MIDARQQDMYETFKEIIKKIIKKLDDPKDRLNEVYEYRVQHIGGMGMDKDTVQCLWIYTDGLIDALLVEIEKIKTNKEKK